jgi:hydrogenase expression/formation protein HypC
VCLAIPARLIEAEGERGLVELGGVTRQVSLVLLPEAQVNDYLLVHAGYALQKVDEEEAEATLRLLTEIAQSEEAEV